MRIIHGDSPNYQEKPEQSYKDFADELLDDGFFDDYIQSSYWEKSFSTEHCLKMLEDQADLCDVVLVDLKDFNYDVVFHNAYELTEKGLS